CQHYYSTPLTC
nr:immunoglobulin light chain junction region [Macaca mulatta]MPN81836.1 immunoglobulin light chain junction region [Macaca mulatta]MPN81837.1 immunoglobulin light chain junction region [Macaca mulatta]MPN82004.1 immunoglobulin light chain junction region [Macaca mulatta]MPN82108.1 immunoglobulin light chain junction region [Macaca mulatta]